jgi:hypothetical protein
MLSKWPVVGKQVFLVTWREGGRAFRQPFTRPREFKVFRHATGVTDSPAANRCLPLSCDF